uniref:LITAF domain-containing protein n=1 Tax=Acrobeloides nanus TaxID=290746 RepID=A0A914ELU7_9BILA
MKIEELPPLPPYSEIYPSLSSDVRQRHPEPTAPAENYGSFPPAPQFPAQNVITVPPKKLGPIPVKLNCPYCHVLVMTNAKKKAGILTWAVFIGCIIFGFWFIFPWCLAWVPFYLSSCLDVVHECPSCKRKLGRYTRI